MCLEMSKIIRTEVGAVNLEEALQVAVQIYARYREAYGGEVQGLCLILADEIAAVTGGVVVAGYVEYGGGSRSHWWVEVERDVVDPMGDDLFGEEPVYVHVEEHRQPAVFRNLLSRYEHFRLPIS